MEGSLRLMDVPPDDIETWLAAQAKVLEKQGIGNRDSGIEKSEAKAALQADPQASVELEPVASDGVAARGNALSRFPASGSRFPASAGGQP